MTEHDRLLNRVLNVASRPALREENGDKVLHMGKKKKKRKKQRLQLFTFMDPRVCVCLCVAWETESTRAVKVAALFPGRLDEC